MIKSIGDPGAFIIPKKETNNMRCALRYDDETDFKDQKLAAWGELQSLGEEPAYKEEDIVAQKDKDYFFGFKCGIDEAVHDLDALLEDDEISEDAYDSLIILFTGELAMQLFSILDHQEE